MALIAQIYRSETDERRVSDRHSVGADATLRAVTGVPHDVRIEELSTSGFMMETTQDLPLGATVWVGIAGAGINAARVVRQVPGGWACSLLEPISEAEVTAALLRQSNVIAAPWAQLPPPEAVETLAVKWPRARRFALIIGSGFLLWAVIIGTAFALL